MSFFDGTPNQSAKTPRLGVGKYSELTVEACKVYQGTNGTRFIVELRVTGPTEAIESPGFDETPYLSLTPVPEGVTASWSVRLDDKWGYGLGDCFAFLSVVLGRDAGKEDAEAAIAGNGRSLAGAKLAAVVLPKRYQNGNTGTSVQWHQVGDVVASASPSPSATAKLSAADLGWQPYPGRPDLVHDGEQTRRLSEVEEQQLRAGASA